SPISSDSDFTNIRKCAYAPSLRDFTKWRVDQRTGEQCRHLRVHAKWLASLHLRADGAEVHEPRLEQGACHALQRLVHAAVQFDLVIQCSKHTGDGFLLGYGRK